MLKFLRRYNKVILVVGGSILMVLFLLPAGASRLLGRAGLSTVVASVNGRSVTLTERNETSRRLQIVSSLAPELLQLTGVEQRNTDHWLLLVETARQAGLVGGPSDGEAFLPQMAEMAVDWMTYVWSRQDPQRAAQMRAQRPRMIEGRTDMLRAGRDQLIQSAGSADFVDQSLAEARGVVRLLELNNTSTVYSTRAAVEMAKELADTATINYASIPAAALSASIDVPEEELQAHFERYKSTDSATDPLGIGYLQPDKVDVEWLTIDRIALESRLALDPIEINKYWRQNRDRFPNAYEDSQAAVESAFRSLRAGQVIARLNDLIRRRLHASTSSLQGSRYKELPADWDARMPSLSTMAEELEKQVVDEFSLAAGMRVVSHAGPAKGQTQEQLQDLAGIGSATLRVNESTSVPFPQYATTVRELAGDNRFNTQQGLVYGPVENQGGSQFYFRVNHVRPSGPPDSLADVRERAVADYRIARGMEMLEARKEEFRTQAVENSLEALGASATGAAFVSNVEVTGQTVRDPNTREVYSLLDTPEFRSAVMAVASKMDPTVGAPELPADQRTVAVIVPQAKSLVVAQVQKYRPLTAERFREIAVPVRYLANTVQTSGEPFDAYTFETLSERLNFKVFGREEEPEQSEGAADSAPSGDASDAG